jgi:hypothetical protein
MYPLFSLVVIYDYNQHAIYTKDSWLMAYQPFDIHVLYLWVIFQKDIKYVLISSCSLLHIFYVLWFLINLSCCRKGRGFINCCIWQRPKQKPWIYWDHHWHIRNLKMYVFISFFPSLLLYLSPLPLIWLPIVTVPIIIVYYSSYLLLLKR